MQKSPGWLRGRAVHWIPVVPCCVLAVLIAFCSVNVPFWDQWDFATLFVNASNGSLGISDLLAQHTESRPFFPRLFFLGAGWLTHWDVRLEMFMSLALVALTAGNIYRLCRITFGDANAWTWLCCCLVNLLLFNPVQHENWLWGMQLMLYTPAACISTCLVLLASPRPANAKFLACAALCTVATFSYANGMCAWLLVLPALLCAVPREQIARIGGAWMTAFGANLFVYFSGYISPARPGFSEALKHPLDALHFLCMFLGSPLGWGFGSRSMLISTLFGAAILVILAGLVLVLIQKKQRSLWLLAMPWLVLAGYGLITSAITTLGRFPFGFGQALVSRYIAFSIYALVGLLGVLLLLMSASQEDEADSDEPRVPRLRAKMAAFALLAVFVLTQAATYRAGIGKMQTARRERAYGKACLLCIQHTDEEGLGRLIYPDVAVLKTRAQELNAAKMLSPELVDQDLRLWAQNVSEETGARATFTQEPGGAWQVSGTGVSEYAVVISRENKISACVPVAVAEVSAGGSWSRRIPAERLQRGDVLTAWGIDTEKGTLTHLGERKVSDE